MNIKNKFLSMLCGLGMLATVGMTTLTVNADAVTPVPVEVNYVTSIDDTNTPFAFTQEFTSEGEETQYGLYSFTLLADSYVSVDMNVSARNAGIRVSAAVATNPTMANPVLTLNVGSIVGTKNETEKEYGILKAGTYFVKITRVYEQDNYYTGNCTISSMVKAVPVSYVMNPTITPSSNYKSATVNLNSSSLADIKDIKYVAGGYSTGYDNNIDVWNPRNLSYVTCPAVTLQGGENAFTVTKNGKYTIRLELKGYVVYSQVVDVNCIDKAAPKITGVKNKKTYKKPVTIKVKDSNSGIKKITLNGKKIKSTKKITKPGKYKVVAIDKAGNKKTITFTIKK